MTLRSRIEGSRRQITLLARYGISGGTGAVVQTATLYVWVSILGLHATYLLGAVLGFGIALAVSFILQKYWTFRDRKSERAHRQFVWYGIVAIVNVAITTTLLAGTKQAFTYFGFDFFGGWYVVAHVLIVGFASFVSFMLNYFVTFRDTTLQPPISEKS